MTTRGQKNYAHTSAKVGFQAHPAAWPGGVRYYMHLPCHAGLVRGTQRASGADGTSRRTATADGLVRRTACASRVPSLKTVLQDAIRIVAVSAHQPPPAPVM